CISDTEDMKPVFEKTANFTYARLRHERYSKADLKEWSEKLKKFASDLGNCFIYFMHDENGDAAHTAVDFNKLLIRSSSVFVFNSNQFFSLNRTRAYLPFNRL